METIEQIKTIKDLYAWLNRGTNFTDLMNAVMKLQNKLGKENSKVFEDFCRNIQNLQENETNTGNLDKSAENLSIYLGKEEIKNKLQNLMQDDIKTNTSKNFKLAHEIIYKITKFKA